MTSGIVIKNLVFPNEIGFFYSKIVFVQFLSRKWTDLKNSKSTDGYGKPWMKRISTASFMIFYSTTWRYVWWFSSLFGEVEPSQHSSYASSSSCLLVTLASISVYVLLRHFFTWWIIWTCEKMLILSYTFKLLNTFWFFLNLTNILTRVTAVMMMMMIAAAGTMVEITRTVESS